MAYADGIVIASPRVGEEVRKMVAQSGKPVLETDPAAPEFFDNYNRFYEAL